MSRATVAEERDDSESDMLIHLPKELYIADATHLRESGDHQVLPYLWQKELNKHMLVNQERNVKDNI